MRGAPRWRSAPRPAPSRWSARPRRSRRRPRGARRRPSARGVDGAAGSSSACCTTICAHQGTGARDRRRAPPPAAPTSTGRSACDQALAAREVAFPTVPRLRMGVLVSVGDVADRAAVEASSGDRRDARGSPARLPPPTGGSGRRPGEGGDRPSGCSRARRRPFTSTRPTSSFNAGPRRRRS